MTDEEITTEQAKCLQSVVYFANKACQIRDDDGQWVDFHLWPEQVRSLRIFVENKKVAALKARQIGFTWLALARCLHALLFQSGITVLIFSLREKEAQEVLSRLQGMYDHLPPWLKFSKKYEANKSSLVLPNESRAMAFPSGTGDSYTAKIALVDEADLIGMDLSKLINSVQPTIEAGGQLYLVSKSNKLIPDSPFKKIYRSGRDGESDWATIFCSWKARPTRTKEWYEELKRSKYAETGSHDYIFENYPNTDLESLSPSVLDKRIPADWLMNCFREKDYFRELPPSLRFVQGLRIYREVTPYRDYTIGIDCAEGLASSDDSVVTVLDRMTCEEVACYWGKASPRRTGEFAKAIAKYYNKAPVLVERNNHGHSLILWWEDYGHGIPMLMGYDDRPGWNETRKSKTELFVHAADSFRDGVTIIHTQKAVEQLQLVGSDTLKAPEGEHDDLAMAYVLALMAAEISPYRTPQTSRRDEMTLNPPPAVNAFGVVQQSNSPFGVRPH